jgi:hypothetical protein
MRRTTARAQERDRSSARGELEPAGAGAAQVDDWWASVLAGDVSEPHPVYGGLRAHIDGGRLRLSGELDSQDEHDQLVRQARERIGRGIDRLDLSRLTVAGKKEKPGILHQTLMSAFPSLAASEFGRAFVLKHTRVRPLQAEVVDSAHADRLAALLPEEFIRDAGKALDKGGAVLILRVDETAAFRVRELLEEETRSEWTIAVPPQLYRRGGQG